MNAPPPILGLQPFYIEQIFGDGSDGDVTIEGVVRLTRNMNYRNLTIPEGSTLHMNGYSIRCSNSLIGTPVP